MVTAHRDGKVLHSAHNPAIATTHYLMDPDADENFRRAAGHRVGKAARREGNLRVNSSSDENTNPQKTQQNHALRGWCR